jgi:hypothetical protein
MWRIVPVSFVLVGIVTATGCGHLAGDCSGGSLSGNRCINTEVGYQWTNAKATDAVLRYNAAPMVKGRITRARCQIVARFPAYEARAVCHGSFTAPNHPPRHLVIAFALTGGGSLIPDCSIHWQTSPYCRSGKHRSPVPG